MTQMNAEQLANWASMPWASDLEEQEALSSPEYQDSLRGASFRLACHAKTALALPANAPTGDLRGLTIQMGAITIGENTQTLEQELAASPLKGVLAVNESRLGLSGRDPETDALQAFDENGRQLQAGADAVDAKAQALGDLVWNGRSFVPRGK
jgi:hypothetical protein